LVALLGLRRCTGRHWSGLGLIAIGLVIAFGSKESAVMFPVLAAIEVWAWQPGPLDVRAARRVLARVWPFVALSLLYFTVHRLLVTASSPLSRLNAFNAVPLALEAWGRYAALLLWPDDLTLGRAMVRVEHDALLAHPGYAVLGAALLLLVLGAAWRLRRTQPAAALGLLAFGALLLPVSGIVWLGYFISVSPRFLYIPLLGLALALAALLAGKAGMRPLVRLACFGLLTLLGARAFVRSSDFSSDEAFWRREISANRRYPAAQQFLISRELNAGRPRSALRLAHGWFQLSKTGDGSEVGTASLIRSTVAAVLALTPDVDRQSLRAVQAFTATLAGARPSELELPRLGLNLRVAANSHLLNRIADDRRQFLIMSGEAASRIGDDAAAVEAVEAALDGCSDCWTVLVTSALLLARAGELDRAVELAERAVRYGPPGSRLGYTLDSVRQAAAWKLRPTTGTANLSQVGFHSTLGSFGRAYAIAYPAIDELTNDPASLHALGELAFRAGDVNTSRNLLGRILPTPAVDERLAELSRTVRWFEQPSEPGEWVPD
jgi:tetratricopeptide (TPR) repeat protein